MQRRPGEADIVPFGVGDYTATEAARLLKTSPRTILRWLAGYRYRRADGRQATAPPLWRPQIPRLGQELEIGFHDLIELRFVLAFLSRGVALNVVRRCLENARRMLGEERPLSTHRFRTDGKSIFLDSVAEESAATVSAGSSMSLVDLKSNQLVFRQVIEQTFKDLDVSDGSVTQWRPYRGKPSIVIDPKRSFGKPIASSSGAPTAALAQAVASEGSLARVARLYDMPAPAVSDAVVFERLLMAA